MAAAVIQQQPAAIQLRYLQTLVEIGSEHNTTIVFPLPIDLITSITQLLVRRHTTGPVPVAVDRRHLIAFVNQAPIAP